jgi:hypothetical protein
LQLVREEYRQAHPEGYRYNWFCERDQHWRRHLDMVLRQEHKAGEKMIVDWAGPTIPVYDRTTGQAWPASLFVSVLGASSRTYAEATRDQQLEAWIQAHIHGLEFFGGAPTLMVPDNTKTAVTRACRYGPDLNLPVKSLRCITGMRVQYVDLTQRTIRLEPGTTKNGEGREVVMKDSVYTLLSACVIGKGADDFVFTRKDGKAIRSFRTAWENACVRAGIGAVTCVRRSTPNVSGRRCPKCKARLSKYSGLIFHDLRRTAARNLRRVGVAEGVIMKIGGWKTRSVFERYAIVSRTDHVDAMQKLQQAEKAIEDAAVVTIGHENGHAAQRTQVQPLPALTH